MRLLSPSVPAKVAIPKIRKPPPAAPTPGPLVLQLGPDGNYYTKTSLTVPLSSMVVKAETVSGIQSPASYCSPMVAGLPTVTSNSGEDVRNMKRQQRMIKNRESACISRKKKKEYVTSLEEHIKKLTDDNNHLRTENESLKAKVQELQNEKNLWTSSLLTSSSVRKAGAVFALLVVVSLNVVSLQEGSRQTWPLGDRSHHIKTEGRTLMMTDLDYPDTETESSGQYQDIRENYTVSNSPMCTVFQNQSESIRLESELRGWFRVEPTPSPTTPPRRRPDSTSFPSERKERVSSSPTSSSSSSSSGSVG